VRANFCHQPQILLNSKLHSDAKPRAYSNNNVDEVTSSNLAMGLRLLQLCPTAGAFEVFYFFSMAALGPIFAVPVHTRDGFSLGARPGCVPLTSIHFWLRLAA
jgi:hypothetical protein